MKYKTKLITFALITLHTGMASHLISNTYINKHDQSFKLSKYEKSIKNNKQDSYDSTSSEKISEEDGRSESGRLDSYYGSTKKKSKGNDSDSSSASYNNYSDEDNGPEKTNFKKKKKKHKQKSKLKYKKKHKSKYRKKYSYSDDYGRVKLKRFKRHYRRKPLFGFNALFPTNFGMVYTNDSVSKRAIENEKKNAQTITSNFEREENIPEISDEEAEYLNILLDAYESFTGNFQVTYGHSMDQNGKDGVTGKQGEILFISPNTYSLKGTSLSSFGLGLKVRDFTENDDSLTSFQGFLHSKLATVYDDSVSSFGFKLGMHTLMGDSKNTGLLLGVGYNFYNLPSNYSFHAEYNGTLYNIDSEDYETMLESNLNSFFRVYLSQVHVDIGGELNFTNIDAGTYFQQGFIRAGFRF